MLSARLAELVVISDLLDGATAVVETGWVQDAWFSEATATGGRRFTGHELRPVRPEHVEGACLVGAVVHAAGGPRSVRSQPVQRTLDLLWHTLREEATRPVRWGASPQTRMVHVLELTRWNDSPRRTRHDVVALLQGARRGAAVEAERSRSEQAVLAAR